MNFTGREGLIKEENLSLVLRGLDFKKQADVESAYRYIDQLTGGQITTVGGRDGDLERLISTPERSGRTKAFQTLVGNQGVFGVVDGDHWIFKIIKAQGKKRAGTEKKIIAGLKEMHPKGIPLQRFGGQAPLTCVVPAESYLLNPKKRGWPTLHVIQRIPGTLNLHEVLQSIPRKNRQLRRELISRMIDSGAGVQNALSNSKGLGLVEDKKSKSYTDIFQENFLERLPRHGVRLSAGERRAVRRYFNREVNETLNRLPASMKRVYTSNKAENSLVIIPDAVDKERLQAHMRKGGFENGAYDHILQGSNPARVDLEYAVKRFMGTDNMRILSLRNLYKLTEDDCGFFVARIGGHIVGSVNPAVYELDLEKPKDRDKLFRDLLPEAEFRYDNGDLIDATEFDKIMTIAGLERSLYMIGTNLKYLERVDGFIAKKKELRPIFERLQQVDSRSSERLATLPTAGNGKADYADTPEFPVRYQAAERVHEMRERLVATTQEYIDSVIGEQGYLAQAQSTEEKGTKILVRALTSLKSHLEYVMVDR